MKTYEINGTVVFAPSAVCAIRQCLDCDEIQYIDTDSYGRFTQYAVDDELVTVFNLNPPIVA